jgi:type 2 lantibiotic biosynthesis protein LanM
VTAAEAGVLEFWARVFAGGDVETLARRLSWDGWTPDDVVQAVASTPGDAEAPWTDFLSETLARAEELAGGRNAGGTPLELDAFRSEPPFAEVWIPFVRAARARVGDPDDALFAPAARGTLEGALLAEIASLGEAVLFERFASAREGAGEGVAESRKGSRAFYDGFIDELLAGGLETLLAEFAVLARLASSLATDWVAATSELMARLRADRSELAEAFGAAPPVTAVSTGLSDRHHGGRRVVILTFASGARVAYKPRPVGLEAEWNGFLAWLRAAGAPDAPPALRFIARDGYGWAEFAASSPLPDEASAEAYFRSAGGLLAVAWLLGARDFHMDNVVSTPSGPAVVDAEAILQPDPFPMPAAREPRGAFDAANARLAASFGPTGLLTLEQEDAEGRLFDVGGLSGSGGYAAPVDTRVFEHVNTDAMRVVSGRPLAAPMPNLPVLGGTRLKAEDRPACVLRGFAAMYRFLVSHRPALAAPGGPLSGFRTHRLRVVFRASEVYARLLRVLAAPRYLRDGWVRSVALDALNRPFASCAEPPVLWPLVADERASLDRLDIPCFDLGALETDPVSRVGTRVAGHFARSGAEALSDRLARMDETDLAVQVRLLTACLTKGASSRAPAADPAAGPVPDSGPAGSPDELVAEAVRLADAILEDAVAGEDGALTWIDPAAVRGTDRGDRWASYYVYDGGAGVLLFFAAVAATTGLARFREAARRCAMPLQRVLHAPHLPALLAREGLGACHGTGSLVYATSVAAHILGEDWPLALARRAAALVTPERIARDTVYDVEGGSAGAILGLLALHEATKDAGALRSAVVAGEHLVARRQDLGDGAWGWPSPDGLSLGGLAHGTSGIALAFVRLAAAASRDDFLGAARAAYRHEAALFDAATGNWPVLVKDGAGVRRLDMKTWCHGAPGIALSRLAARGLGDPALGRELEIALDATRRTGLLSLDHVCCGNAGLVDTLFTAGEALARPDLASAAQARLGAVLRRARLFGGYRLRGGEEENAGVLPGFFRGHAGIGYMLLRLARPGHFPNVLAFEARGPSGHTMGAA